MLKINGIDAVEVTQLPALTCQFLPEPATLTIPALGGSAAFKLRTLYDCDWSAQSTVPWIRITSGGSGMGSKLVNVEVDPNPATTQRAGTVVVGESTLTVVQQPAGAPTGTTTGEVTIDGQGIYSIQTASGATTLSAPSGVLVGGTLTVSELQGAPSDAPALPAAYFALSGRYSRGDQHGGVRPEHADVLPLLAGRPRRRGHQRVDVEGLPQAHRILSVGRRDDQLPARGEPRVRTGRLVLALRRCCTAAGCQVLAVPRGGRNLVAVRHAAHAVQPLSDGDLRQAGVRATRGAADRNPDRAASVPAPVVRPEVPSRPADGPRLPTVGTAQGSRVLPARREHRPRAAHRRGPHDDVGPAGVRRARGDGRCLASLDVVPRRGDPPSGASTCSTCCRTRTRQR